MERIADQIPECFQVVSGPFDMGEVEAFFSSRREILLEVGPSGREWSGVPLVPLSGIPLARAREYLSLKGGRQRPMNGVEPSGGKLSDRSSLAARLRVVRPEIKASFEFETEIKEIKPEIKLEGSGRGGARVGAGRPKKTLTLDEGKKATDGE